MDEPASQAKADVAALFDEVEDLVERPPLRSHPAGRLHQGPKRGDPARRFRADIERALDLAFDAVADVGDLIGEAWKSLSQSPAEDALVLGPLRPGNTGSATLWIHNLSPQEVNDLIPRLTDLVRHDGRTLNDRHVAFEPSVIGAISPGGSRELQLAVDVSAESLPGRYFGSILVSGLPSARMPVTLVIDP